MPEIGEGDEEQGEELLPDTNTGDASLYGQTPQSTDVPLPRPLLSEHLLENLNERRVGGWFLCGLLAIFFVSMYLWSSWDDWINSNIAVWVKVLFILLAVPFSVACYVNDVHDAHLLLRDLRRMVSSVRRDFFQL